jgi:D-alanyl-D-alanine carboxypeptidase/D-alanyl-D-alanine-endopeptidase (penicillin-binding protein 4)
MLLFGFFRVRFSMYRDLISFFLRPDRDKKHRFGPLDLTIFETSAQVMAQLIQAALRPVALLCLVCAPAMAQTLPEAVSSALQRAKIPLDSVSILIADTDASTPPRLSHRGDTPMNPASVMKLVTTYAALDVLGPAFTWRTPVWLDGTVREGSLKGNLVIQGQGDPKLVQERLLQLLQRVQALGVRHIDGDIVLDRSFFAPIDLSPGRL